MRVVALGLDAAEPWVVDRMLDAGAMPNLAALRERGARADLENTLAYRAEVPWTQFATGVPPKDSGYWTMVSFDPSDYAVWEHGAYDYASHPPFWHELGDRRSIVFDVPQVRITDGFRGSIVTAWGSHSPQYPRAARPQGLLAEIDERFGVHPGFEQDNEPCWFDPAYLRAMSDAMCAGARRRASILTWLRDREPEWDLLVSVMGESHSMEHHCFHGLDPSHAFHGHMGTSHLAVELATDAFRAIDYAIGATLDGLPDDTTVLVFSLHGMRPNASDISGPLLAEVFHRVNFGHPRMLGPNPRWWKARGMPLLEPEGRWSVHMRHRFRDAPRTGLAAKLPWEVLEARQRLLRRLRGTSRPQRPAFPPIPIEPETELRPDQLLDDPRTSVGWQIPTWYERHWPEMRAFVLPAYSDCHVRINLAGRERFGQVAPEDYDVACDEVEAIVRGCVNPRTGRPAFGEVLRVRADDPHDPDGPTADLVVVPEGDVFDALEHPEAGLVGPYPVFRTGEHSPNGFLVAAGPGIEAGTDLGARSALDVTPTILSLLDRPVPDRFAGSPIFAPAVS